MGRVVGIARGRAIRTGLVAGFAAAAVIGFAAPGHTSTVETSGTTECAAGNHVIHWFVHNPSPDEAMSIRYALATSDTQVYSVDGYDAVIAPNASTAGTTMVPPAVTGTISLRVQADWPNGISRFDGSSVTLSSACPVETTTTTTTTQPETTTTQPESTTTLPETTTTPPEAPTTLPDTTIPDTIPDTVPPIEEVTTSTEVAGTTIVTGTTEPVTDTTVGGAGTPGSPTPGGTTTTTKPGKPTLPRTGTATTFLFVFGGLFVAAGGGILMHKRNSWAAVRGHETTADVRKQLEKKKRALHVYLPPRR